MKDVSGRKGWRLVAVEVTDAAADVLLFVGSLSSGALSFENDPANVVLIVLAALGTLSAITCVALLLLFFLDKRQRDKRSRLLESGDTPATHALPLIHI